MALSKEDTGNGFSKAIYFDGLDETKYKDWKIWASYKLHRVKNSGVAASAIGAELINFIVPNSPAFEVIATLDQAEVDASFKERDILTNCRSYPIDEAPAAYKDFNEVLCSVERAGLASEVARLEATFVIKDGDKADD